MTMESATETNTATFGLPDLSALTETERLQVLAVMQRAKEFDEKEDHKGRMQPLEGQLNKYTNVMKGWQFRWFVLEPESGMFEYFEKEEHKKQRPRGCVHLAAAVISPSDEDSQTFTVSAANGEIYRLRASNTKERQLWVDRLRTAAEYHTANIANATTSAPRREQRSASFQQTVNDVKKKTSSRENIPSSLALRSPNLQQRAPAPHPHTLDPFKEVKEYLIDAEDYSHSLYEKIDSLPQTGEPICGLDRDLLLIKATSSATLSCMKQCLDMLQHKEGPARHVTQIVSSDWSETRVRTRTSGVQGDMPSPTGSFTSAQSLPYALPESKPEGPINHNEEVEDDVSYKDTDLGAVEEHKSIILHLLSQLKLGMDLTKVVLPTFILERRSLLEMFADCMAHPRMFLKIPDLPDPESRMIAVVEWYLSSFHAGRQGSVAKKPYNPIIGETFHCSWRLSPTENGTSPQDGGTATGENTTATENGANDEVLLTYCAEQVSHHPPISAFYFECPDKQICMNASIYTKSRFLGMSIGVNMIGKLKLKLLKLDEEYIFGLPSAYARSILTYPWAEMGDKITFTCPQTNVSANITFHTKPFYGGKLHRVSAEIKNGKTGTIVCKVQGEWNNVLEFTNTNNGETNSIDVNNLEIMRKRVRPLKSQGEFESRKLWQHVTNALRAGDINTATEHKRFLEERQREGERHRKETQTAFPTKYFHKEGDAWIYNSILQNENSKQVS